MKDINSIYKKIVDYFDKLEDRIRGHLSHYPVLYTMIGGVAIILFWRGVWHTADILEDGGGFLGWLFYEPVNMVIVAIILLLTGLFVSAFIGSSILISGMKGEKKMTEKTEKEVKEEEIELSQMRSTIKEMKKEVDEIKEAVVHNDTVK